MSTQEQPTSGESGTSPLYYRVDLPPLGDDRGSLVAVEDTVIGFDIKRVYYIFGTKEGVTRGGHAHMKLQQLVIAVTGSCDFILDDGVSRETVHLDNPTKGLRLGNMIWREMTNFSPDCVLVVIASENYDEADYIRDYDAFLEVARAGR
jgi:dTDP-4-dehydrorhamnose 3,5-epimerase-like enzyme